MHEIYKILPGAKLTRTCMIVHHLCEIFCKYLLLKLVHYNFPDINLDIEINSFLPKLQEATRAIVNQNVNTLENGGVTSIYNTCTCTL